MASIKKRTENALKLCGGAEKDYRDQVVTVAKKLLKMDNVLIFSHRSPDGDTLGSAFALCRALRKMGKRSRVIVNGVFSKKCERFSILLSLSIFFLWQVVNQQRTTVIIE